ncbi:MAG: sugar transporter, partial [Prevotella sp.]
QKNYVVTAYFQTATLVKTFVQMASVYYIGNLYLWVAVELGFGIIHAIILNWKIRQTYPWLSAHATVGKQLRGHYPEIVGKTKQVFVHKIKDFLLQQSDQILIFAFVSLKMVAYYGNYTLIITRITMLFNTVMDGIVAGVGNLIAEGDQQKIYKVFWEMVFVRYLIAGIVVFAVYHGIQSFICLWLGEEYLLSSTILILLLVNTFIMLSRGAVDLFNMGYGNYHDTWSAWVEGAINISVTLITCYLWGLPGVLIGKIASIFPIIVIWKPLFLYRAGFQRSIEDYWKNIFVILACFACSFVVASGCSRFLPLNPYHDFIEWVGYCLILTALFTLLYLSSLLLLTEGARNMMRRVLRI